MTHKKRRYTIISTAFILWLSFSVCVNAVPIEAYRSYVRGLLAMRAGDVPSALDEYQRVATLDKNAVPVYRDLAVLYLQVSRPAEAVDAAEQLEALDKDNLNTQLFLGSFYLLAGQSGKARNAWEHALALDPANQTAILYLAAYHSSDNEPEKAIEYWNKYIRQDPNSAEGHYQLGMMQEKIGKLKEARESFLKTISLKAESSEAHLALAQIYEKEEKFVAAAQEYERYLELVPDNMAVLVYLGGLYYRLKNFDASEGAFLRAKEYNPQDTSILFWLGVLAEEKKDWKGAIRYFETINAKEKNTVILTRLGYYYSMQKDYCQAVKYLKKVVQLEPANPNGYYLLGLAYFDEKKFRLSERNFLLSLERKPDREEVYFHLGVLYDRWGKFNKAVEALEKVIQLNPKHSAALNYLGYSYADRGVKLEEAEALVLRALSSEPDNASFVDSLGWVRFKRGNYEAAEQELERASAKLFDPVIWEHLGDVRVRLNKNAEAWDAYQKALDLDPGNKKIIKKLNQLEKLVLPGTLQRKLLKRAAGNLLQVRTLSANFTVSGQASSVNFRFLGMFQYLRPEQWRVDILGNFMAPSAVIIQNQSLEVYPRSLRGSFSPESLQLFENIKDFFNTRLLDEFDGEKVQTKVKGHYLLFEKSDKSLLIDRRDGTVREYQIKDRMVLRFRTHSREEGLHLPSEINMYYPREKTSATLKLYHFILNKPMEEKVFTFSE
jgi:tetratricopeptide (TPR) repeat protein